MLLINTKKFILWRKKLKKKYNLETICIYLYILLKPFYLSKSGTLQISDIFIIIAFILTILNRKKTENAVSFVKKNYKVLLLFLFCVISINFIYFVIFVNKDFIMCTSYYIFIAMGVYVFINKLNDKKCLNTIYRICAFNIFLQVLIFISGLGRQYTLNRYMGTFNDPNQFGFFIIQMLMIMSVLQNKIGIKKRYFILSFILGCFLIYESASTGMILSIGIYLALNLVYIIPIAYKYIKKYISKIFLICGISLTMVIIIFLQYITNYEFKNKMDDFINNKILNSSIIKRINEKVDKASNMDDEMLEDRNLEQIIEYPQYLIFRRWTRRI